VLTRVLYLLFTLGGVSALIYEVIWMRSFRVVFGSSTRSAAVVLAAYFAGMALGSLLGARLARRSRPIRSYGWAEITVGLTALLVHPWLALFGSVYPELYGGSEGRTGLLAAGKLLLAFGALGPPTIAMGVTLPLVSRAVVSRTDHVARRTGLLYAFNIVGATAGAVLAAFILPPSLGIQRSVYLAVGLNLMIGLVALRLRDVAEPAGPRVSGRAPKRAAAARRTRPDTVLLTAAAISGFGTLALEVLFVRILSQRTDASVYTFGLMLVTFLLFLAIGAALVARWLDTSNPWRFLGWTQLAAVAAILLAPLAFQLVPVLAEYSRHDSLSQRLVRVGAGSVIVLGPSVCLIGMVLPSTWKIAARSVSHVGEQVGVLTGANTLAGVAGSLIAGFVLLPRVGLGGSILAIASLYALLAIVSYWRGYRGIRRWVGCAACVALVAGWYGLGVWRVNFQPLREGEQLVRYRDGETASVAVIENPDGQRVLKVNHTYTLGSSGGTPREVRQGRLPLLLHPEPERVAFIGVATGITTSAVLDFPVERVVAIELVPGVVEVLPDFEPWNRSFFRDGRVEIVVADGRNHLRGTSEQFDVIVSDLFVPWHAGTGDLYSVEHFEAAVARLAPGGLFVQWLPGYQLTAEELRTIAASFLEAFPEVALWRSDFHAEQPILGLAGYREGASIDPLALRLACERLARVRTPAAPFLSSPDGVGMLYVAGDAALREWARGARLNTDDRPRIEYSAPKSFFQHRQRDPAAIHTLLARFRPRAWGYDRDLPVERPIEDLFRAADLLNDAAVAKLQHNFEREYRHLKALLALGVDVPGVSDALVRVAARYRDRHMTARSQELLYGLLAQPRPPVRALLALATLRRADGDDREAVVLLERALERAPGEAGVRRALVEVLEQTQQFERAELHLRPLLDSEPNDPRLRLDLAYLLDRQGKREAASAEVARVRAMRSLEDREAVWRYLQRRGLGSYLGPGPPH
jgi:spermidine synthase